MGAGHHHSEADQSSLVVLDLKREREAEVDRQQEDRLELADVVPLAVLVATEVQQATEAAVEVELVQPAPVALLMGDCLHSGAEEVLVVEVVKERKEEQVVDVPREEELVVEGSRMVLFLLRQS